MRDVLIAAGLTLVAALLVGAWWLVVEWDDVVRHEGASPSWTTQLRTVEMPVVRPSATGWPPARPQVGRAYSAGGAR